MPEFPLLAPGLGKQLCLPSSKFCTFCGNVDSTQKGPLTRTLKTKKGRGFLLLIWIPNTRRNRSIHRKTGHIIQDAAILPERIPDLGWEAVGMKGLYLPLLPLKDVSTIPCGKAIHVPTFLANFLFLCSETPEPIGAPLLFSWLTFDIQHMPDRM
ncbi:uncharacterized protein [Heterodontus francisci]|uniref:uncharacterized protein isoform X3 n=1 Tax=Heterodontus francisci TaxID=7792 RepID=UPI00355B4AC9